MHEKGKKEGNDLLERRIAPDERKLNIHQNLTNQEQGQPNNFSLNETKTKNTYKMMKKFTVYQNLISQEEGQQRNI
jgi:hypothetical protein